MVDYDAAEKFIQQARDAEKKGDTDLCLAARKMAAIALDLGSSNRVWPLKPAERVSQ